MLVAIALALPGVAVMVRVLFSNHKTAMDFKLLIVVLMFLLAACAVVPLAQRFRLGSVLGYLLAGIAIAPAAKILLGQTDGVMSFAEYGVVMMMFLIGMELEPAILWRLRRSIVGLGGLQVTVTSLALMTVGILLGHGWQASLAVGMALAMSSTALVLQMLGERNLTHTLVGETAFSVLLFQDMAVIPVLIIIPLLATAGIEVDLTEGALRVQAVDFGRFTALLPRVARDHGIRLLTVSPSDESLESVFSYLVAA